MPEDPQIEKIMLDLTEVTEKVITKVTLDATANLIDTTPIDTGWARANWVPSVGSPASGPVGSREAVDRGAQDAGLAAAADYRLPQGQVFISNHVPYVPRLNDGHSQQAPAGFIENAIEKAVLVDLKGIR